MSSRSQAAVVLAIVVVGAAVVAGLTVYDRSSSSTCLSPKQAYTAMVRSDGAIGYWRLDETTGRTAQNSARLAQEPDGRYVGLHVGRDVLNNAGVFSKDAAVDLYGGAYVAIPAFARYRSLPHWSVEAWVNPIESTSKGGDVALLSHAWHRSSLPFVLGFGSYNARYTDARHAWTGFYDQAKRRWSRVADTAVLPLDAWTHLVGTYDGGSLRLYKNGLLVDSKTATGAPIAGRTPLYIGTRWWLGAAQFFFGRVAEVALYPVALRPTQIERHYATAHIPGRAPAGC